MRARRHALVPASILSLWPSLVPLLSYLLSISISLFNCSCRSCSSFSRLTCSYSFDLPSSPFSFTFSLLLSISLFSCCRTWPVPIPLTFSPPSSLLPSLFFSPSSLHLHLQQLPHLTCSYSFDLLFCPCSLTFSPSPSSTVAALDPLLFL